MTTKTRLALAAVLLLGIASAAQAGSRDHGASGLGWLRIDSDSTISRERASARGSSTNAPTCPWLEGYPDCHPDAEGF